jgi:hypothetical protein
VGSERERVVEPSILSEAGSTSGFVVSAAEEELSAELFLSENLGRRVGFGSEDMVVGVESVSG